MAKITWKEYLETVQKPVFSPRISKFYLKDVGDSAIIRFAIEKPDDLKVYHVHSIWEDNGYKDIECLRTYNDDPFDKCPLCANKAGTGKVSYRIYIPLLVYEQNNETGTWEVVSKVWPQSLKFKDELKAYYLMYEDLRDQVFMVVKIEGNKYKLMPPNWKMYSPEAFENKDFSVFNGFSPYSNKYLLVKKSYDEMIELNKKGEKN